MDIVKKNLFSIICGVIALVALVAVFVWPLNGYYDTLHSKVSSRAAIYSKVEGLMNKPRSLPVLDLSHPEAGRLTKFPSREVIKVGEAAQQGVKTESEKVYNFAWNLNLKGHGLNVPFSLPTPSPVTAINFRREIKAQYDRLREDLEAGVPPTPEERNLRADAIWKEMEKKRIIVNDQVTNEDQVLAEYNERTRKLPEEMKQEMATRYKVYMSQALMQPSPMLPADGKSADVLSIWWTQVEFWVWSDVASAIHEANAKARNVTEAPVKHLVNLVIKDDFFPSIANGGAAAAAPGGDPNAAAAAAGALPDPTVALPDNPLQAQTPTKRMSNNLYDVVQFSMTVDVEADQVPMFLKTLSTNRFITVTRLEMNPVDSQLKQILGYVYGNRPVVTLDMDCEALFMRQWTVKLMPEYIKKALGIPTDSTPPGGAPAAPGAAVAPRLGRLD
jgi:hypothetical protein